MEFKHQFVPEIEVRSRTNIFSRLQIWSEGDLDSVTPTWEANYGDALIDMATQFDEELGFWLLDDFNDVVGWDDDPTNCIVEKALMMRQQRTSEWKGSVTTVNEPLTLRAFQNGEYFSYDSDGHVVVMPDSLSLKAFLEDRVDTLRFVEWIAEHAAK